MAEVLQYNSSELIRKLEQIFESLDLGPSSTSNKRKEDFIFERARGKKRTQGCSADIVFEKYPELKVKLLISRSGKKATALFETSVPGNNQSNLSHIMLDVRSEGMAIKFIGRERILGHNNALALIDTSHEEKEQKMIGFNLVIGENGMNWNSDFYNYPIEEGSALENIKKKLLSAGNNKGLLMKVVRGMLFENTRTEPPENIFDLVSKGHLRDRAEEMISTLNLDLRSENIESITTKRYLNGDPYGTEVIFVIAGIPITVYIQEGGKSFSVTAYGDKISLLSMNGWGKLSESMHSRDQYYSAIDLSKLLSFRLLKNRMLPPVSQVINVRKIIKSLEIEESELNIAEKRYRNGEIVNLSASIARDGYNFEIEFVPENQSVNLLVRSSTDGTVLLGLVLDKKGDVVHSLGVNKNMNSKKVLSGMRKLLA